MITASQEEQMENTHPFVTFTLKKNLFALSAMQVREILRMQEIVPVPQSVFSFIEGVIHVRNRILPIVDLRKRLGFEIKNETSNRIMVVRLPKALIGFVVDSVKEVVRISSGAIHEILESERQELDAKLLSGIARVGQNLILLPNLSALLKPDEHDRLAQIHKPSDENH